VGQKWKKRSCDQHFSRQFAGHQPTDRQSQPAIFFLLARLRAARAISIAFGVRPRVREVRLRDRLRRLRHRPLALGGPRHLRSRPQPSGKARQPPPLTQLRPLLPVLVEGIQGPFFFLPQRFHHGHLNMSPLSVRPVSVAAPRGRAAATDSAAAAAADAHATGLSARFLVEPASSRLHGLNVFKRPVQGVFGLKAVDL